MTYSKSSKRERMTYSKSSKRERERERERAMARLRSCVVRHASRHQSRQSWRGKNRSGVPTFSSLPPHHKESAQQPDDEKSEREKRETEEKKLRLMRELVEKDTVDSAVMRQLANLAASSSVSASQENTSASTPQPSNSIQQAAMLEELFNRNYRDELEQVTTITRSRFRPWPRERDARMPNATASVLLQRHSHASLSHSHTRAYNRLQVWTTRSAHY